MNKYKRIFLIVVDSLGCGGALDANLYQDEGSNTLYHVMQHQPFPQNALYQLGISNIISLPHLPYNYNAQGYVCTMQEQSQGKDTLSGHYELMGCIVDEPFQTFTETGFPLSFMEQLKQACGHGYVGNCAASGTEIIKQYGEEVIKTGDMIIYTSSDSVLQIAAHEQYFGLDELYRCCQIARNMTKDGDIKVARVIARPFIGEDKDSFVRTSNRVDYALPPFQPTLLDALHPNYDVIGVGKINDIFCGQGITRYIKSKSSIEGMNQTIQLQKEDFNGLCFINLVDFDMLWGHRRNIEGYHQELVQFDERLTQFIENMNQDDLLLITADHGNDPTYRGSDHTRENVPLIAYSPSMQGKGHLVQRNCFGDVAATIAENFNVKSPYINGKSFFKQLR